ncbi:hypothetical protein C8R43DRAFT_979231 [Mycena crocata]|nr:hypothetical protein C8R43DRAFT_979231 [Mycena crocata]
MTRRLSTPNRSTLPLYALVFLPNALASDCVNGVCSDFGSSGGLTVAAIVGIVFGITVLLSIAGVIFAVVRWRRIKKFQRTYVQNAQAHAATMPHPYPSTAYPATAYASPYGQPMHEPHDPALQNHNIHMNQINAQNNQQTHHTSPPGIGATSGFTAV